MNEFIVWYSNDINKDKFSKEFTLQELISQDHYDYISDSPLLVNYKVDSINRGIGLKDTNGKSIYADSSIVEFQLKDDVIFADFTGAKPTIWNEIKMIGYFVFNNEDLRYEIDIVDWEKNKTKSNFICLHYNLETMSQFKIIDTIQENKLGLIKA